MQEIVDEYGFDIEMVRTQNRERAWGFTENTAKVQKTEKTPQSNIKVHSLIRTIPPAVFIQQSPTEIPSPKRETFHTLWLEKTEDVRLGFWSIAQHSLNLTGIEIQILSSKIWHRF